MRFQGNPNPDHKFCFLHHWSRSGESHAIQACHFGPRCRFIVRGDGDRIGAVGSGATGHRRIESRHRRNRFPKGASQNENEPYPYEERRDHRNEFPLQRGKVEAGWPIQRAQTRRKLLTRACPVPADRDRCGRAPTRAQALMQHGWRPGYTQPPLEITW